MNRNCVLFAALLSGAVFAQDAPTVETLSRIGDFETAELDGQSIQLRGDMTRFDVRVRWKDPPQRPQGAPAGRYIRYAAKCGERSMGVAAVATLDENGRMLKSYVVPPGGSDLVVPAEGSRESRWLQEACR